MPVPSYDDLTPSICDVHPRDTFDQVTKLVPVSEPVVSTSHVSTSHVSTSHVARGTWHVARRTSHVARGTSHVELFACVRGSAGDPLFELASDFSPRIERHGDDCVVLDVSGLGRLLGDAHNIAAELARGATDRGIKARIAVAPTQTASLLLTLHTHTSVVIGDAASAIADVALEHLDASTHYPPPIVGVLNRWGLRTVGEFAALPPDEIAARFGLQGVALQRLARGLDPRPLLPDPGVTRFIQSLELEWPIEELEPLSFVFARLLDPLSASLERADRAGAAIRVDLRLVDRTVHSRTLQLPSPIRDARVLRTLLLLDLESHPPSAGIDVVTIEIDPAPARIVQYSLLERAIPSPETLATLTARLTALVGESRCGSPSLLDSHRPDAFEMRRFTPEDRRTPKHPAPSSTPQYLAPSSTPQYLAAPRSPLILRRFRPPVAMRVAIERGRPAQIANLRKGVPNGRVTQAAGPWRSSGAWWTTTGEHWDRDEWDVALADGSICRLFCDRTTGRWFLDGVFD